MNWEYSELTPTVEEMQNEFRLRLYQADARKEGLKNGLRQLTVDQLNRVLGTPELCVDEFNYSNGKFCPLAIGLGLDKLFRTAPTQETVQAVMALLGYKINNTRGVEGEFYTTNRLEDLQTAAKEVIQEKLNGAAYTTNECKPCNLPTTYQ